MPCLVEIPKTCLYFFTQNWQDSFRIGADGTIYQVLLSHCTIFLRKLL